MSVPLKCVDPTPLSNEERLTVFKGYRAAHRALVDAYSRLEGAVLTRTNTSLLMIFGPTGVGKTTLVNRAKEKLLQKDQTLMADNPGFIPFAVVRAPACDGARYPWRDLNLRILRALQEPHIDKKIELDSEGKFIAEQIARSPRSTSAELSTAVRQTLRFRRTKVLVLDEAQHLSKIANAKLLNHQMEQVKDLADETGVLLVLSGTYHLMKVLHVTGQLCRRQERIHFGRYRAESPSDMEEFQRVVASLDEKLPLPHPSELLGHSEFLYTGSLGIVGVLKDWITRALNIALNTSAKSLRKSLLEQTIMEPTELRTILTEAREGERETYEPEVGLQDIAALLGIGTKPKPTLIEEAVSAPMKRKPGERAPTRDQVGMMSAA